MGFPLLHKFMSNNNREEAVAAQLLLLCSLFLASPTSIGAQEPQQQQLPRPPPQFLTAADFRLAALDQQQEQPVTFLTELDFNNAQKYKDLLEVKARRRSNILTQQRFYRGDIRGKAAWRRERHQRLQELRRREASGSNGGQKRRSSSRRYNGVANVVKKWPNGRIPYVLSTDYSERERAVLARAFQEYHSRTCIRFVPKTPFDHDFLYVGKIDGCYSDVGRAGGKQELSLDDGCLHVDTVIHELMHSVGFYHEHERWDRDNFLVILWQNIDRDAYDQFGRVDLLESSFYGQNYDYTSIMHYDSLAFSRNGRETLVAREPAMTAVIGSATDFSPVDLAKIHKMYQCMEIDSASPLPPSPSSPAIQQSLEFTGDNSILGGGAGTVGEIAIAAAAGIPRLLPPSSPQSFRMPGMTSAQLPAQLLPSGPVLLALGGGRPMPLESQQPLARPQNQQQLQQLQQPHFAAFHPMAAGTPIQQSPQGIPLYLRVNSLASSGPKEEGPPVGENGSSSRQPDSNGLGNKKEELGNAMTEAHSPPTMASSSAQMSSGSLLPMVVMPPAVRKQQRIVCEDRLGLCPLWLPYCRMAFYGQLMRQFCARSCDFCGDDSNINNSNDAANIRHFSMRKQQRAFPVLVNAQKRRRKRR